MNVRADITASTARRSIEDAIERLLAVLDSMEGDPDLEANGDEHDASWPEGYTGTNFGAACEDDEDDHDAEADKADAEPELGWTEDIDQAAAMLVQGIGTESGEPFLGWSEAEAEAGVGPTGCEFAVGPPLSFEGGGVREARTLLARAGPRKEIRMIGERTRLLPTGEFFRTFVPADSGYVVRNRSKRR